MSGPRLSVFTTLGVGGPAQRFVSPTTADELIEATREVWATGEEWLVLGGGSNMVVSDDGFDGTVIRVVTSGIEDLPATAGTVRLRVQAGESWDDLVTAVVDRGLAGIEGMAGIPGSTGAGPIQNIGAYGQELSESISGVQFLDYETGELLHLDIRELGLGYRTSVFKRGRRGLVVSVDLHLTDDGGLSRPLESQQLASAVGAEMFDRIPVADVRDAVLTLRRAKGMVLDPDVADSRSAGSYFTNPIVGESFARRLPWDAARWPHEADQVKLSAAWLIERAGISRGFSLPGSRAAISSRHTLAITNRGEASAAEVTELARFVQERVRNEFGVALQPEPVYVGFESRDDAG